MSTGISINPSFPQTPAMAKLALKSAGVLWFGVAILGQLLFAYYVAAVYGGAVLKRDASQWNKVVPHAYVAGDTAGNIAMGMHVLIAVIVAVGAALQLIPQLRQRLPALHRWNGRLYVLLAVISSIVGLYMVWIRGSSGDFVQHLGITGDALLIMLCAAMAVHHARARRIDLHRRWALRLFMVVSAVWFYRVGLMFSILVNQGPFGFDPATFTGPFLSFISFAQYLVPLAVLELYLRTQDSGSVAGRLVMAAGLVGLTVAMAVGIFAAAVILWLPRL